MWNDYEQMSRKYRRVHVGLVAFIVFPERMLAARQKCDAIDADVGQRDIGLTHAIGVRNIKHGDGCSIDAADSSGLVRQNCEHGNWKIFIYKDLIELNENLKKE